ncbi:Carboxylic ester hydrolase [Coniochaeta hoffmannii]|uniref:Carboxylic ester hydrolase n=1 Tax=Coniochaeta hoffmannii TaxID=91930 RepID=A0AA38VLY5_9PEZI|nr:Carboxylic ester hydrolase [Coniochaeta hoffmannii]
MCELYTAAGQPVYSYRFDTRLWNKVGLEGVQHFDNVAYSFQNISGLLGPSPKYDAQRRLSRAVGVSYINFVNSLDPNGNASKCRSPNGGLNATAMPYWPKYDLAKPQNLVFNATSGPFLENDTFRKEGIAFLNTFEVVREMLA